MKTISISDSEQQAIDFLASEWEFSSEEQEWLSVLSARLVGESWYVIEIGVEGLPDRWILQVYDTGECDPNYTFASPIAGEQNFDLEDLPEQIAAALAAERHQIRPN